MIGLLRPSTRQEEAGPSQVQYRWRWSIALGELGRWARPMPEGCRELRFFVSSLMSMVRAEMGEQLGLVIVASGPSEGALVFELFGETAAIDEDSAAFLGGDDVLGGEEFGLVGMDDGVAGATEHHEVAYCSEV